MPRVGGSWNGLLHTCCDAVTLIKELTGPPSMAPLYNMVGFTERWALRQKLGGVEVRGSRQHGWSCQLCERKDVTLARDLGGLSIFLGGGIPKVFRQFFPSQNLSVSPWQQVPAGVQGFTHPWRRHKTSSALCMLHCSSLWINMVPAKCRHVAMVGALFWRWQRDSNSWFKKPLYWVWCHHSRFDFQSCVYLCAMI